MSYRSTQSCDFVLVPWLVVGLVGQGHVKPTYVLQANRVEGLAVYLPIVAAAVHALPPGVWACLQAGPGASSLHQNTHRSVGANGQIPITYRLIYV